MSKYYFHVDAGHGWLAVKRAELERLNLLDKISSFYSPKTGDEELQIIM